MHFCFKIKEKLTDLFFEGLNVHGLLFGGRIYSNIRCSEIKLSSFIPCVVARK